MELLVHVVDLRHLLPGVRHLYAVVQSAEHPPVPVGAG